MSAPFVVERGDRLRMTFTGEKAKDALGGLVTNDVVALRAGEGQRAAALTAKGRVIALCRVFDRGTDLLVDCDGAAAEGFVAMIRKFVNPRLARYAVVTESTDAIGVFGDGAAAALSAALSSPPLAGSLEALAPFAGRAAGDGADAPWVFRSADLAVPGFECIGEGARVTALRGALQAAGLRTATADEVRAHRVELGLPEWGVEMDAETLPQEAVLDALGAISFSKGCYTGQEVVARIHFRGHVNRLLRHVTCAAAVPAGTRVLDAAGTDVGDVRSCVMSTARGPLAIAMVRREVAPGSEVTLRAAGGATDGGTAGSVRGVVHAIGAP